MKNKTHFAGLQLEFIPQPSTEACQKHVLPTIHIYGYYSEKDKIEQQNNSKFPLSFHLPLTELEKVNEFNNFSGYICHAGAQEIQKQPGKFSWLRQLFNIL